VLALGDEAFNIEHSDVPNDYRVRNSLLHNPVKMSRAGFLTGHRDVNYILVADVSLPQSAQGGN
jgi:hypothetical protein